MTTTESSSTAATTTHTPGVYINSKGKKTFVPLENNPEVFTELAHRLGVSDKLGFHDIYSIDDPDLLAFVPRPCLALIFIAPADVYHRVRAKDGGTKELKYDGSGDGESVMWFKQTIGHSCGLMALIHSIANGPAKHFISSDSLIANLLQQSVPLKPLPRAAVLYNSAELEKAHMSVAFKGDSAAPMAEEPNGYHFISFVKGDDGHLYELEGGWNGPIDLGPISADEDGLSEKALDLGIRRFVKEAEGNMEFSMIALTGPDSGDMVNGS